jgi:signal transduction histidine kinase
MSRRNPPARARALAAWLALGAFLMVSVLAWFGYRATREWQRSSALLAERRAEETANLLALALARDMRGVQQSVLLALHWDQVTLDRPHDVSGLVASAFARYPYPESFFGWHVGALESSGTPGRSNGQPAIGPVVFLTRASRPPPWLRAEETPARFPVTIVRDPPVAGALVRRVSEDAAERREFSLFETRLGGDAYQIVARLFYRDALREDLVRVFGFAVNLDWVREAYFPELTRQIARIGAVQEGLASAILDDRGAVVVGTVPPGDAPRKVRPFPLFFFDPPLVALDRPPDLPRSDWTVQVSAAADPTFAAAVLGARRTLLLTALGAIALGIGLVLMARAVRVSAELAEMRSDFVSTVTHELKTPLATIGAVGQTLVRGRLGSREAVQDYAQVLVQETKRLTRLVDNLLAYSRITDVGDVYSFEPVAPADLLEDALHGFQVQFADRGFRVGVEASPDLPLVRADRTAMRLVLDNVIDNAIRYSGDSRVLDVTAAPAAGAVAIAISDRGVGIPPDELEKVLRRFVRGRQAASNGSGLGLAIARRIVRDHGGTLAIRSAVGAGTTVRIDLPLMEDTAAHEAADPDRRG